MCRKYKQDCAFCRINASQIVQDDILRLRSPLTADLKYKHRSTASFLEYTTMGSTPQKKTSLAQ